MLDKLYITPKQWLHILRWSLYALALLFVMMVQTVVFGSRTLLGVHPDLVPIVLACVCLREGPSRGGWFALIGSLFWCLSGAHTGSVCIAVVTIIPVLGGLFSKTMLVNRFVPDLIFTVLAVFTEQLILFLIGFFFHGRPGILFLTDLLPCVLISCAFQPPIYWLVTRVEKVGDAYESV